MKTSTKKPKLKLTEEDGNIFSILALAVRTAREAGWTEERIEAMTADAQSGDYNHALQVVMKHFDVR